MKKILVITALTIFSFANAQKGSILVMGSVGYNSQKDSNSISDTNQHFFTFSPKVGYQFHENWTGGIEGRVSTLKQELSNNNESKNTSFGVGGFIRYSKPLNETFSAYADFGVGYQNTKTTNNIGAPNTEGDGVYAVITPAIFINVSKGFGLNFNIGGLGYSTLKYDGVNGNSIKSFNFNLGQAFSVGISKNF